MDNYINLKWTISQKNNHKNLYKNWLKQLKDSGYSQVFNNGVYYAVKTCDYEREVLLNRLRNRRQKECFDFITEKGPMWLDDLKESYPDRYQELVNWRKDWLDVTITLTAPEKPNWI